MNGDINGDIVAGGDVDLGQHTQIDGDLNTEGTLSICHNADVTGEITADDIVEQQC